jgi:acetyl esterase/lipase
MEDSLTNKFRFRENIPDTISRQAQDFMKIAVLFDIDPSRGDWPEVKEATYKFYEQLNTVIKTRYVEKLETLDVFGVPVSVITPKNYDSANDTRAIYYIHGGAYVLFSPQTTFGTFAPLAFRSGIKIYAIDYRLAPEHPYPAAPDDCFAVYRELVKKYSPNSLGLFGDSAGGALALVTALRAHKQELPLPAAMVLSSPWVDITKSGDSYYTNEGLDIVIHYEMNLRKAAEVYAGNHDMRDPGISPIYADLPHDLPPTMILTGTRDLFLSNCVRLYRAMKHADTKVELNAWEGMWHDLIGFPDLPETDEAFADFATFFKTHLK